MQRRDIVDEQCPSDGVEDMGGSIPEGVQTRIEFTLAPGCVDQFAELVKQRVNAATDGMYRDRWSSAIARQVARAATRESALVLDAPGRTANPVDLAAVVEGFVVIGHYREALVYAERIQSWGTRSGQQKHAREPTAGRSLAMSLLRTYWKAFALWGAADCWRWQARS